MVYIKHGNIGYTIHDYLTSFAASLTLAITLILLFDNIVYHLYNKTIIKLIRFIQYDAN